MGRLLPSRAPGKGSPVPTQTPELTFLHSNRHTHALTHTHPHAPARTRVHTHTHTHAHTQTHTQALVHTCTHTEHRKSARACTPVHDKPVEIGLVDGLRGHTCSQALILLCHLQRGRGKEGTLTQTIVPLPGASASFKVLQEMLSIHVGGRCSPLLVREHPDTHTHTCACMHTCTHTQTHTRARSCSMTIASI